MVLDKKKLVVLMLVPDFPISLHQIRGGVHSAVISLLEGFSSMSDIYIQVLTFTKIKQLSTQVAFSNNCSIHYIWEGPFNYHLLNYTFRSSRIIKRFARKFKPDIIHYQVGNGFLLSKILLSKTIPLVQTIHGFSNYEARIKKKSADKFKWELNHYLNEKMMCQHIIHLSHFSENLHKNNGSQNNSIIPNSVKSDYFKIKPKAVFESKLLFIGQLDKNKNALFAVNLLHQLSLQDNEYRLDIAGGVTDSYYHNELLDTIKAFNLQDRINFHGWINEDEKLKLLENIDVLIVPSYHESFPMVILEGLASSKIILANQTGGIPEIIKHNSNGFLLDIKKSGDWVKSVQLVTNNKDLREHIQLNAREYAFKHFSSKSVANATGSLYKKITHNASH